MYRLLLAAISAALLAQPASAEAPACRQVAHCDTYAFTLASASDSRRYGVMILAPADVACAAVRFRVRLEGAQVIGQTPPLRSGESAVVRIGRGFPAGDHRLLIEAAGCPLVPADARRVTLAKASPDHGWRWPGTRLVVPVSD